MIKGLSALEHMDVDERCNWLVMTVQYATGGQVNAQAVHRPHAAGGGITVWAFWVIKDNRLHERVIGVSTDPYGGLLDLAVRLGVVQPEMPEDGGKAEQG